MNNISTKTNSKSKNRPIFIEEDEAMTEEEKEMAFLEYMKLGYHHPSMTKIIEDKAALTTLELSSTKKVSEEEWPNQFDLLKHLETTKQHLVNTTKILDVQI